LDEVIPSSDPENSLAGDEIFGDLSNSEQDLPGLLQSLKKDGEIGDLDEPAGTAESESAPPASVDLDGIFAADEPAEEEKIPDWLAKIRQRAKEDPDAVGDITQKLSAALETLADDKDETRRDEFQSWIENIRKSGPEPLTDQHPDEDLSQKTIKIPSQDDEDWLIRIRKAEGKIPEGEDEDQRELSDQKGDSLLQWLVALEEGREKASIIGDETIEGLEDIAEETHPTNLAEETLAGELTQKIAVLEEPINKIDRPFVDISSDELEQANQFIITLEQEHKAVAGLEPVGKPRHWIWRLLVSLILITSLVGSMWVTDRTGFNEAPLPQQNEALFSWVEDLQTDASLLLIFNFQPGYASEVMRVARPVLGMLAVKDLNLSILSSTPTGGLLAESLLTEMGFQQSAYTDLGYFPVGSLAAYGIMNKVQGSNLQLPTTPSLLSVESFDGILILSDQAEDVQSWVEQFTALMADPPIFLLLTAQAGPMSLPYWESGQVDGMISGVSEAAGFEAAASSEANEVVSELFAHQIGLVTMMIMLILGLFIRGKQVPDRLEREQQ
jgi:hypothetical protein